MGTRHLLGCMEDALQIEGLLLPKVTFAAPSLLLSGSGSCEEGACAPFCPCRTGAGKAGRPSSFMVRSQVEATISPQRTGSPLLLS